MRLIFVLAVCCLLLVFYCAWRVPCQLSHRGVTPLGHPVAFAGYTNPCFVTLDALPLHHKVSARGGYAHPRMCVVGDGRLCMFSQRQRECARATCPHLPLTGGDVAVVQHWFLIYTNYHTYTKTYATYIHSESGQVFEQFTNCSIRLTLSKMPHKRCGLCFTSRHINYSSSATNVGLKTSNAALRNIRSLLLGKWWSARKRHSKIEPSLLCCDI